MSELTKSPSIKEIIVMNKVRSLICSMSIVLTFIFLIAVIKNLPYISTNLAGMLVCLSVVVLVMSIIGLISPKIESSERYLSVPPRHELQVDSLLRVIRYGVFGGIVYLVYVLISAIFNWNAVFTGTFLGKQLDFIVNGSSDSSLNLLMSKSILVIYVVLKLLAYFTALFCASKFLQNLGNDFKQFTLPATNYLKLVGIALYSVFYIDMIFWTIGSMFDVNENWSWPELLSFQEDRAGYFVLLFFFGSSIYILSNIMARGVELEEEVEATI